MWEKEKLLVTSNFSFFRSVFYPFGKFSAIFTKFEIVVCKLFQIGWVYNLSFGKGLTLYHTNLSFNDLDRNYFWKHNEKKKIIDAGKQHFLLFSTVFSSLSSTNVVILATFSLSFAMFSICTGLEFCHLVKSLYTVDKLQTLSCVLLLFVLLWICNILLNSLPNDKMLDFFFFQTQSISKRQNLKCTLGKRENIVGKGENAGYQHFILFPQCFQ